MAAESNSFASVVGTGFDPEPENNIFDSLFKEYERVVFQSVITSFGLDGFIEDRLGGDVDTVLNVSKGEAGGGYKSSANAAAYENRGAYNKYEYLNGNKNYRNIRSDAKNRASDNSGVMKDAYTGADIVFSESAPDNLRATADHIIARKTIHDDKGRVLSGLNGPDLANSPENIQFTSLSFNSSMQDKDIPDYIAAHPELPEEQKAKMMEHYETAKKSYDAKINRAYYTSRGFWKDTGIAAAKMGGQMALRQALGFVMTEVWFAVKDALREAGDGLREKLEAVATGIKRGFENAKDNLKDLFSKVKGGAVAGVLSSLTTTLCNIFFTTAKNIVRIIRQTWASIVEATKILVFNPDNLPFPERMKATVKIIAAGASVVLGTVVQEAVHKALNPPLPAVPVVPDFIADIVSAFAGSLCTGFLSVSLLYFIDNDPFSGYLKEIDKATGDYKRQAALFANYAAELEKLDIDRFEEETAMYHGLAQRIENAADNRELNKMLVQAADWLGVKIPWGDCTLDEFMNSPNAVLRIEA